MFITSLVVQMVKNPPALQETWVRSLVGKMPWRAWQPTPVFFPHGQEPGRYNPWGCKESDMTQ